jgi:hypothetical protein
MWGGGQWTENHCGVTAQAKRSAGAVGLQLTPAERLHPYLSSPR